MAGDGILANGVTKILKGLSILVAKEIGLAGGVKDELQNLKKTLAMILVVMDDAEKKQVKNEAARMWLEELKDIAYEAEDILDDYSYQDLHQRQMTHNRNRVSNFFSPNNSLLFRLQIARQIENINEKLSKHAMSKETLGLPEQEIGRNPGAMDLDESRNPRETSSIITQSLRLVGRVEDKSNVMEMLLHNDSQNQYENIQVISIVGMAGSGKSTLAQLIYNDETVRNHFDLLIWVCVSDDFNVKKLFNRMIEAMGYDMFPLGAIEHVLQQRLRGRKYLIVLDDVWNKNWEEWLKLRRTLAVADSGSKIIVTTRSDEVASIMSTGKPYSYKLGMLNENESWSLFHEGTFGWFGGAVETPTLTTIGKELVGKCEGLPLAIIFLISLVRYKNENEWRVINKKIKWVQSYDNEENGILSILKLSYDHLPSHLKQCFSFFSLFGKGYTFDRKTMILLWMAEGFLPQPSGRDRDNMEEVGSKYFNSLLWNSFFQDVEKDAVGQVISFTMHDLIHDLAQYVAGDHEFSIWKANEYMERNLNARRLKLFSDSEWPSFNEIMSAICNKSKLRTLLVFDESIKKIEKNAFDGIDRLRVLDLHEAPNIEEISSSSMSNLKHLRYLDLSYTKITNLPESVTRLYYLQTLKLSNCVNLKELPKGVEKLINLRHLFLPKDISMPREIEQLSSLQTLQPINIGRGGDGFGSIEILEGLNLLNGEVVINHLRNLTSGIDARRANLKGKKNLNKIYLNWHTADVAREDDYSEYNEDGAVLEALEPHPNLKLLAIDQYFGAKLPRWVGDTSCLPNLTNLQLSHCTKCEQLVEFGKLPSLKELRLLNMDGIKCLGYEFYYNNSGGGCGVGSSSSSNVGEVVLFPSLKELVLGHMASLEEWVDLAPSTPTVSYSCFPYLEKIVIECCPNLRILPTYFPSLKELTLQEINERVVVPLIKTNRNSLFSVELEKISELNFLPRSLLQYNSLWDLKVMDCPDFQGFLPNEEEEAEFSISLLSLVNLPVLKFLPDVRSFTSLEQLYIEDCESLKPSPEDLTCLSSCLEHLKSVVIENVKEVEDFQWEK